MDKHFISTNPLSGNGQTIITRTVQPVSIYEVVKGHQKKSAKFWKKGIDSKNYTFVAKDGQKIDFCLKLKHYYTVGGKHTDESQIYKFMDDAWHYFAAWLKSEDQK